MSGQLHATAALPIGKDPRYPSEKRLGGSQSLSGGGAPLPGIEPLLSSQAIGNCNTCFQTGNVLALPNLYQL